MELFRQEAISHQSRKRYGEVLLRLPLRWTIISSVLAALSISAVLVAAFAKYPQVERVSGWIIPRGGIIRMTARDNGVVSSIRVTEGSHVNSGQVLVSLRLSKDIGGSDAGMLAEASLKNEVDAAAKGQQAQLEQLMANKASLAGKIQRLHQQLDEQSRRGALAKSKEELAKSHLDIATKLRNEGFLSQNDLDAADTAYIGAQQEISNTKTEILNISQQIADAEASLGAIPATIRQVRAQSAAALANFGQQIDQIKVGSGYEVTTPVGGRVLALPTETGQSVNVGSLLAIIIPDQSQLEAEIYVPSKSIGFIKAGQEVSLHYQAFPYQKYGSARGRILSVSNTVLTPQDLPPNAGQLKEPVFRARVSLPAPFIEAYRKKIPLQPGMLLEAQITVNRRNILELLLDPVYALARR